MPHYSMVGGRRRQEERVYQERLQAHIEGTDTSNIQGIDTGTNIVMKEQVRDEPIEEMLANFQGTMDF